MATCLWDPSYSVHILHSPILVFVGYVLFPLYPFTRLEALLAMRVTVVPVTLIASGLMYRFVERPMIRLGARLAAGMTPAPAAAPFIRGDPAAEAAWAAREWRRRSDIGEFAEAAEERVDLNRHRRR